MDVEIVEEQGGGFLDSIIPTWSWGEEESNSGWSEDEVSPREPARNCSFACTREYNPV